MCKHPGTCVWPSCFRAAFQKSIQRDDQSKVFLQSALFFAHEHPNIVSSKLRANPRSCQAQRPLAHNHSSSFPRRSFSTEPRRSRVCCSVFPQPCVRPLPAARPRTAPAERAPRRLWLAASDEPNLEASGRTSAITYSQQLEEAVAVTSGRVV